MNKRIKGYLKLIIAICLLWVSITTTIMRFIHPEYTDTELFINIPKAFILNFN